jgi:hypothetical protein
MTKEDIKFVLEQEIEWWGDNFDNVYGGVEFKVGFIAGLRQALFLLLTKKEGV